MAVRDCSDARAHVLVVGGGFAALELVLALRAISGDALRVSLVSPDPLFVYRPAATVDAFSDRPTRSYDLSAIAADLAVSYHRTKVRSVFAEQRRVGLESGSWLSYDALVLAVGARATAAIRGALTFRDPRDLPAFRGLLDELDAGNIGSLVFAVPSGVTWPFPLYELALLTAGHLHERRIRSRITLLSPERRPLELLGSEASGLVASQLDKRGVRFLSDREPSGACGGGALALQSGAAIAADRIVAVPRLTGVQIPGLPTSWQGFAPTDTFGRVEETADVYAAGDVTTFPIKQGGLASQQADRVAHSIAADLGFAQHELRPESVLNLRLIGGERPLLLRIELDSFGRPVGMTRARAEQQPSWTKVFGRYLTPFLETRQPVAVAAPAR